MIRAARLIGLGALVAVALASCARGTSSSAASLNHIYAGGLKVSDIAPLVDDGSNWWPAAPTFGVRPLNVSSMDQAMEFTYTQHFVHVGTPETLAIAYRVWNTSSTAQAVVSQVQSSVGSTLTGPAAGDQSIYFTQQLQFAAAPYVNEALVRVGQVNVSLSWYRISGFATGPQLGRFATKIATQLRSALAGKVHLTPQAPIDARLLPAPGPDITLLGADHEQVEVLATMLGVASPNDLKSAFTQLGVTDFTYGDYALDADTRMEVQTSTIVFGSNADATAWLDAFFDKTQLDANGVYFNFDPTSEQYFGAFVTGTDGAMLICKSSADFEAASRACEQPAQRVLSAWKADLPG